MIGLVVIAGVSLYIGICWLIFRALKQRWARALALLTALAIPLWDLPFGYYEFRNHCRTAGLQVLESLAPHEAAYFDSLPPYPISELFSRGFRLVETADGSRNKILRYERSMDGRISTLTVPEPRSELQVSSERDIRLPWNIVRDNRLLRERRDGRLLAKYSEISWRGGWLQVSLTPLLGPGIACTAGSEDPVVTLILRGGKRS